MLITCKNDFKEIIEDAKIYIQNVLQMYNEMLKMSYML